MRVKTSPVKRLVRQNSEFHIVVGTYLSATNADHGRGVIGALREAAERLGESPTKQQYEKLGLTPAASTILRVVGGWNEAKEKAGLTAYDRSEFGGTEIQPKPDEVELPEGLEWRELTGQQRWYYKNRERRIGRKEERRRELRQWLHAYKLKECECERCGEGHPACLDFHHFGEKEFGIAEMVVYGYSRASIEGEIERCGVLCANCHRKEHYVDPT